MFSPSQRPRVAILRILDDGSWTRGESIRIRTDRLVIGRLEGDVIIRHDEAISSRHAELFRRIEEGQTRWFLKDLDSRNGTFIRVTKKVLNHGHELLLGGHRFQFHHAPADQGTPGLAALGLVAR